MFAQRPLSETSRGGFCGDFLGRGHFTREPSATKLWLVSYGLIGAIAALNLRIAGVALVGTGMLSNLAAIVTNGGHMPALPSALRAAGLHITVDRNSAAEAHPHLAWLVDRWAAPDWIPLANVFSVGDVGIALGGFAFALGATGALARLRRHARPAQVAETGRALRYPTARQATPT